MRRLILIIAICTGVLWGGPVGADEADDALFLRAYAAYKRGDYAEAATSFRALAEKGDADAQYNLGVMYGKGQGVPQDYAEAMRWYYKAAEKGFAEAPEQPRVHVPQR